MYLFSIAAETLTVESFDYIGACRPYDAVADGAGSDAEAACYAGDGDYGGVHVIT